MRDSALLSRVLEAAAIGGLSESDLASVQEEVSSGFQAAASLAQGEAEDLLQFRGASAGRSVPIPPANIVSSEYQQGQSADLMSARFNHPRVCTITLSADGVGAFARLSTKIGAAPPFSRLLPLRQYPRNLQVYGSEIQVSVFNGLPVEYASVAVPGLTILPTAKNATGLLSPAGVNPLGDLWPVFSQDGTVVNTLTSSGVRGPGVLLGTFGYLTAVGTGDSAEFIQFWDIPQGTNPVTGVTPAILSIGPLTAANQPFSFERSLRPDVFFDTGLVFGVSKTDISFTTPGAGANAQINFDWSQ